LNDPRSGELLKAAADVVRTDDETDSFFAVPGLFPKELQANRTWRDRVNSLLKSLR
jgi:fructuronate reductase